MLDRVVAHDRESTTATVRVANQRWLTRRDGSVEAWLAIEYMAQCVAAHEGMVAYHEGRVLPLGFLVSVTRLHLGVVRFGKDEELHVRARRIRGRPGLGVLSHACAIFHADHSASHSDERPVAEGRLSIAVERPDGRVSPANNS